MRAAPRTTPTNPVRSDPTVQYDARRRRKVRETLRAEVVPWQQTVGLGDLTPSVTWPARGRVISLAARLIHWNALETVFVAGRAR